MSAFTGPYLTVPMTGKGKKRTLSLDSSERSGKSGEEPTRKKGEKGPCYQCKEKGYEDECNEPLPCGLCKRDFNIVTYDCSLNRPIKDDVSESSVSYGDLTPEHESLITQDQTLVGGLAPGVKGTIGIIPAGGTSTEKSPSPTLPVLRDHTTRSPPASEPQGFNTPESSISEDKDYVLV